MDTFVFILSTDFTFVKNFEAAAESVKTLTERPTDQELLDLYALFKQGSFGDNNTSTKFKSYYRRFILLPFSPLIFGHFHSFYANFFISLIAEKPGMFDLKGKAKWNSWNDRKGMSQDEAKEKYVSFVGGLMAKYPH